MYRYGKKVRVASGTGDYKGAECPGRNKKGGRYAPLCVGLLVTVAVVYRRLSGQMLQCNGQISQ